MKELTCTNCGRPLEREVSLDAPQWCDDCYERHAFAGKITNLREVNPIDLDIFSDQLLIDTLRHRGYIVTPDID